MNTTVDRRRRLSRRVSAIQGSATLAVDAKAKALRAAGRDVIGFGAGEPDFPTPEHIVAAAERACRDPRMHHYTPAAGLPELREAISQSLLRDSRVTLPASQVLVTNGGKQAVYAAFATVINEGDEVLLPAPWWTTYPEAVALAGGIPVSVPTTPAQGHRVSVAQLEAARTERTAALLLCSPSNPTGAVQTPEELAAIGRWAVEHDLWVVTDEIYQHLVYGDARFASVLAEVPELAPRCVIVNGVAKTFAMTGWRVGWLAGPPDVVAGAVNLQSHSTSNVANVSQAAALAALSGGLDDVVRMREAFDRRRRYMHAQLSAMPGITCPEPLGAFYCFPSVSGLLGHTIGGTTVTSSAQLAEVLLEHAGVAVVPGEAFGAPGSMRLSYALGDDDLAEGLRRLGEVLGEAVG